MSKMTAPENATDNGVSRDQDIAHTTKFTASLTAIAGAIQLIVDNNPVLDNPKGKRNQGKPLDTEADE